MIFNLSVKSDYNQTVFDDLTSLHNTYKDILARLDLAYNSKCIKCHLPAHKPKLRRPKTTTLLGLTYMKIHLPNDLIKEIVSYIYEQHEYHPNGCADCIFMIERPVYTISDQLCYELFNLSNISGYGERAVSSNRPKFICVTKMGEFRSINECNIDNYSDKNRDAILKVITKPPA